MELTADVLNADPRNDWLTGLRIFEHKAQLAGRLAEIDIVDGQRLTLAGGNLVMDDGGGALVVLGVDEPATVRADARPIFIGLAERDLARAFERLIERNVP